VSISTASSTYFNGIYTSFFVTASSLHVSAHGISIVIAISHTLRCGHSLRFMVASA
jgi:hypothetical protein